MAQHNAIPQFSMALSDSTAMFARLAKDRPVSLYWIDVNRASHLFGFRIRNQSNVNGDVRITTELNNWLARLAAARPDRFKLSGTGGDEILVVDEGEDEEEGVAAVCRLIEAGQSKTRYDGAALSRTLACAPLTMACGGVRTTPGADGHSIMGAMMANVRQAKVVGAEGGGSAIRSVLCYMGRNIPIRSPDDDPADDE